VIYLDVERTVPMTGAMRAYVGAWLEQLAQEGQYRPGIYCSVHNAADLQITATAVLPTTNTSFWVAGNTEDFSIDAEPAASGVGFADIWQGQLDVSDPFGIVPSRVDVDLATSVNPSGAALL
jgi:GH25 family lysozyme M1 (1,4-beta-N-acetylmuramidase)